MDYESENLENNEAVFEDTGTSPEYQDSDEQLEVSEDTEETSEQEDDSTVDETEEEIPEWKSRFSDEQTMYNSYRNAERGLTQTQQELAELRRTVAQLSESKARDPELDIAKFAEEVKKNPVAAIENIADSKLQAYKQELKRQQFTQTFNQYMQNPEFAKLEGTMAELAGELAPRIAGTSLENDPKVLDFLYLAAQGVTAQQKVKKASATAKKKGELSAMKKSKARIEGGSSSGGKTKINIDSMSAADLEKAIRSGRLKV